MTAESIFTRWPGVRNALLGYAINRLQDRQMAEDAVHDTLLRCLEQEREGKELTRSYIWTSLHHRIADVHRRDSKYNAKRLDRLLGLIAPHSWNGIRILSRADDTQAVDARDTLERLLEGADLSPFQLTCLELAAEGHTHAAAARLLGTDIETVKYASRVALLRLRKSKEASDGAPADA